MRARLGTMSSTDDVTSRRAALVIAGGRRVPRALIALMLAISVLMVAGCERAPGSASARRVSSVSCAPHVVGGVLPSWARAGFSEPNPGVNYELGRDRDIAAILF